MQNAHYSVRFAAAFGEAEITLEDYHVPIFEYQCEPCSSEFELLIRGDEKAECPSCGNGQIERLFSAPAAPVVSNGSLPMAPSCPPSSAPPCSPICCRLP
ncbi:MAG: FmdB family zinc ribbon protein [Planctomycetales bacterium]